MRFHSILFGQLEPGGELDDPAQPPFLRDLNLDQVIDSMTVDRLEYRLDAFFYTPLRDVDTVRYRHAVFRDLEDPPLLESIGAFAQQMHAMRTRLVQADRLHYKYEKEGWFLDATATYCDAVSSLAERLSGLDVTSRGLLAFRDYLLGYTHSSAFTALATETRQMQAALAQVTYRVHVKGHRVRVGKQDDEPDYSVEVEKTFARFKQGAVKDYRVRLSTGLGMNHVEARILELVARLYRDVFQELDGYCGRHRDYVDPTIRAFDREVQFYLAYLQLIEPLKGAGLPFCYPHVSARSKEVCAVEAFDLALAGKLVHENSPVVCNDLSLSGAERVLVVTGPNQGGKSTFARMFGQLHYLASLGCPVPGKEARLFLPDRLFTHFEREEDVRTLRGKLEDELVRLRDILRESTSDSVVIMNESLTSTSLSDAVLLGKEVMRQLVELDLLCVWVTFVDELSALSEATVSMVSTVAPDNPAVRTYAIVRRPADGRAYAAAIAEKYGLTYDTLRGRIAT